MIFGARKHCKHETVDYVENQAGKKKNYLFGYLSGFYYNYQCFIGFYTGFWRAIILRDVLFVV